MYRSASSVLSAAVSAAVAVKEDGGMVLLLAERRGRSSTLFVARA
jgi:hypothetical protein